MRENETGKDGSIISAGDLQMKKNQSQPNQDGKIKKETAPVAKNTRAKSKAIGKSCSQDPKQKDEESVVSLSKKQ